MDWEYVKLIAITISLLSIFVGYNLIKGGKKMENNNIVYAGVFWLIITLILIILSLKAGYDVSSSIKDTKQRLHQNTRPANAVEGVVETVAVEDEVVEDEVEEYELF